MDPHTARCLQLSTSISMPFNPYRPHHPVNRSRFPVNAPQPQVQNLSGNVMGQNTWRAPATQGAVYQQQQQQQQQQYRPVMPQRRATIQHYQVPQVGTWVPPKAAEMEASYFQASLTPEEHMMNNPWEMDLNPRAHTAFQQDGLGLKFSEQEQNYTPSLSTTTESFEDLIKLDNIESWEIEDHSPASRSWSPLSTDSTEGAESTDFSGFSSMPTLNSTFGGLGTPFSMESSTPKPPYSHGSDERRPRQMTHEQLYSPDRTRCSSTSTAPSTECCSPAEDCHDDFMLADFDFNSAEASMPHDVFDPKPLDFEAYFNNGAISAPKSQLGCNDMFFSNPFSESMYHNGLPTTLPSSAFTLELHHDHPVADHHRNSSAKFAEEPDLFGPLREEQLAPPPEDMKPEDPDMEPRAQELRFEGDLYTPKWVRGYGNKREGWCGLCKPGRWLVLKNSAFWYDKSFTHGVSAATGQQFEGPKETRRMSGNPDVWEGLCGSCGDWIALISSKKKGTTWFRHAYKCHTHQKAKETPKRRRESAQNRVFKVTKTKKPVKQETRSNSPESIQSLLDELEERDQTPSRKMSALQTISSMI